MATTLASCFLRGVRLYNPLTGRFLQTDPIPGGSANDYDYADQDPINKFDLDGRMCLFGHHKGHKGCRGGSVTHPARSFARHATLSFGGCIVMCIGATVQEGNISFSSGGFGLWAMGPAVGWNTARVRSQGRWAFGGGGGDEIAGSLSRGYMSRPGESGGFVSGVSRSRRAGSVQRSEPVLPGAA